MTVESLERRLVSLRASRAAHEASSIAFTLDGDLVAAERHAREANALQNEISRLLEKIESYRVMS